MAAVFPKKTASAKRARSKARTSLRERVSKPTKTKAGQRARNKGLRGAVRQKPFK